MKLNRLLNMFIEELNKERKIEDENRPISETQDESTSHGNHSNSECMEEDESHLNHTEISKLLNFHCHKKTLHYIYLNNKLKVGKEQEKKDL